MALFQLKKGCGKHHTDIDGKLVTLIAGVPGQDTIECDRYELGSAIDKFIQLTPDKPEPLPKETRVMVHRKDGKGYDVILSTTGKRINTKPLTQEDAEALVDAQDNR